MARGSVKLSILSSYDKKGTDQAEKALEKFAKKYGQVDEATKALTLDETTTSLAKQSIAADQLAAKWDNVGQRAQAVGGALTTGLTVPIAAAGAAAATAAMQYETASSRIAAALGGNTEQAERFAEIGQTIYENGWGQSLDEVTTALLQTKETIRDIDEAGLETVTTNALMLSQVFGADVNESIRGINALMEGFGLNATEATDLMTAGMQRGLNYTDELGDNLSEYSVRWGEAGMSAEEYFSLLEAGASNGAYNLDKVGDFLNEFLTSLSDGRMESSIGKFSQGTQDVFNAFKNGGATAEDVLNSVLSELDSMPNSYEKAQIASELWSSLGEDNALGMISSLANVENSYGNVQGAAEQAANEVSESFAMKAQAALRQLQGAIEPLGEPLLRIGGDVINVIGDFTEWFSSLDEGSQNAIVTFAAVAAAVGPVTTGFGKMASAGSSVLSLYADITAKMAQNSAAAAGNATAATRVGTALSNAGTKARGFLTVTNAAKAGAIGLGIALAGVVATQIYDYIKQQEQLEKATEGLENAQYTAAVAATKLGYAQGQANIETGNAVDAASNAQTTYENYGVGLGSVKTKTEELLTAQAQLADKIGETFTDMYASNAQLDAYRDTINQLANQSGLTAQEQGQLQIAVDKLNEACGTSYSVIDAENGVIADQNGVVQDNTDAINDMVEAKKRSAEYDAINAAYTETLKQQVDAEQALADAKIAQQQAQEDYDAAVARGEDSTSQAQTLRDANAELDKQQALYDSATGAVNGYYGQLTLLQMAEQQGADSNAAWLSQHSLVGAIMTKNGQDVSAFAQQLDNAGIRMTDFGNLSEEQLSTLAANYDGSLSSIAQACHDQGIAIPQSLRDGILNSSSEVASATGVMKEAMILELTGGDVELAAEILGHDISQGLKDGITGAADLPQEAIGQMSDETIAQAKEMWQSHSPSLVMYQLGTDINQGLANGINDNQGTPLTAVQTLGQLLLGSFSGLSTSGWTAGFGLMGYFASGINLNMPTPITAAAMAGLGAVGAASSNSNAYGAGTLLSSTFASGVGALAGTVSGAARSAAIGGTNAAKGSSDATAAGKNLSSTFATSINSFSGQANARGMVNEAKSSASRAADASNIGRNLSSSFANGIDLQAAVNKAAQMATNALHAAERALGIASPSKEFTALGEYSAEGFALGFDKQADLAVKASRAMATDALNAANVIFDNQTAGASINYTAAGTTEIVSVLNNQQSTLVDLLYEVRLLRTTLGQTIRASVNGQGGLNFANENEAARWVQRMAALNV